MPAAPTAAAAVARPTLYTSRSYEETAEHVHLLWPHWGVSHWHDRYAPLYGDFIDHGRKLFTISDRPEEADFFMPPSGWQPGGSPQAYRMAEVARKYGKPLLLFFCSDSDENIPIEGAIVYRTSMARSTRRTWEHAWPIWTCDVLRSYGSGIVEDRPLSARPSVGYCGYIDYRSVVERVRRTVLWRISPSMRLRGDAVRALQAASEVDARIILRRHFSGDAVGEQRQEFANNLLTSDYALVARGAGNFSFRLYEAMSAGTIPVFIDTDCCLPYDDAIPYRDLFVWVPAYDVRRIGEYVREYHSRLNERAFNARRRKIREVYDQFLSPLGFHRELACRLTAGSPRASPAAEPAQSP
jgi:Exostosin family